MLDNSEELQSRKRDLACPWTRWFLHRWFAGTGWISFYEIDCFKNAKSRLSAQDTELLVLV